MLQYLADLMEDASDFSWASAKASHAVLLCEMEQGSIKWSYPPRIDRIRRAHAQKHTSHKTNCEKIKISRSLGSARLSKLVFVVSKRIMRSMARHIGTYVPTACLRVESWDILRSNVLSARRFQKRARSCSVVSTELSSKNARTNVSSERICF